MENTEKGINNKAPPRAFEQYLTTREVANILRLTPKTVRELILTGDLGATKFGGSWRIKERDFLTFVRKCEEDTRELLQKYRSGELSADDLQDRETDQ
jgi:excisionase family DNA binding protein